MGLFSNWRKKNKKEDTRKKLLRTINIQSTGGAAEGHRDNVWIESMLTGRAVNISVPGTSNGYTNYESQVMETYKKYNSNADFGCQQVRAIIDLRTAFIAGEGISVSAKNPKTAKWLEEFIRINKLNDSNFINAVKGSEMSGQNLFILKKGFSRILNKDCIRAIRIPYNSKYKYKPAYNDNMTREEVIDVLFKDEFGWTSKNLSNFIYTRIGGDDGNSYGPVTRVGTVLTDCENYDRAIKDIRRVNHIFARITPTFKTNSSAETKSLKAWLTDFKWKIGKAFIGTAQFDYKTPKTEAHDNLISELTSTIKTISSTTGIPVHWLGFVDLMSNRSTAQTLYEFIKNATIAERIIWEGSLYELILKAQELHINNGLQDLDYDYDFQVRLPLISFEQFLEKVKALNIAYNDEAISINDYRNAIPGIDPLKTSKDIEEQKKKEEHNMLKMGIQNPLNNFDNLEEEEE